MPNQQITRPDLINSEVQLIKKSLEFFDAGSKGFEENIRVIFEKLKAAGGKNYEGLLYACQSAYKKHHKGDDGIGWEELSDILLDALCNAMGDDEFVAWNENK